MKKILLSLLAITLLPAAALAANASTFELTIKDHKFEPTTLEIPANTKVVLHVKNTDATAEEFESSDLSREKVIAPNSDAVVKIGPLKPGTYKFVGEYHEDTAKGEIIVK